MRKVAVAAVSVMLLVAIADRALFAGDATSAPAGIDSSASHDGTSPVSRCGDLCGQLYRSAPDNRVLCEEGCAQAERCTSRCNKKFADDGDKLARCNYRCARAR